MRKTATSGQFRVTEIQAVYAKDECGACMRADDRNVCQIIIIARLGRACYLHAVLSGCDRVLRPAGTCFCEEPLLVCDVTSTSSIKRASHQVHFQHGDRCLYWYFRRLQPKRCRLCSLDRIHSPALHNSCTIRSISLSCVV